MDRCLHWLTDHKLVILWNPLSRPARLSYHSRSTLLQPASREAGLSFQTDFVFIALYQMDG